MKKDSEMGDRRKLGVWYSEDEVFDYGIVKYIGGSALLVYFALCRHANSDGKAFPSVKLLTLECDLSNRVVAKSTCTLKHFYLLQIERNKHQHNIYYVKSVRDAIELNGWQKITSDERSHEQVTKGHPASDERSHEQVTKGHPASDERSHKGLTIEGLTIEGLTIEGLKKKTDDNTGSLYARSDNGKKSSSSFEEVVEETDNNIPCFSDDVDDVISPYDPPQMVTSDVVDNRPTNLPSYPSVDRSHGQGLFDPSAPYQSSSTPQINFPIGWTTDQKNQASVAMANLPSDEVRQQIVGVMDIALKKSTIKNFGAYFNGILKNHKAGDCTLIETNSPASKPVSDEKLQLKAAAEKEKEQRLKESKDKFYKDKGAKLDGIMGEWDEKRQKVEFEIFWEQTDSVTKRFGLKGNKRAIDSVYRAFLVAKYLAPEYESFETWAFFNGKHMPVSPPVIKNAPKVPKVPIKNANGNGNGLNRFSMPAHLAAAEESIPGSSFEEVVEEINNIT